MTYQNKVQLVRENIVLNAQIYKSALAGRFYLYIFENQFYELSKNNQLQAHQIFFSNRFPLKTAIQKTSNLSSLPNFIKEGYFVIKDLVTETATYPYAITNIEQSTLIGLKEEESGDIFIPRSFRVRGKVFDKADVDKIFEINCILSKKDKNGLYDNVLYKDEVKIEELGTNILEKIDFLSLA